jgi:HEAT repeat protein
MTPRLLTDAQVRSFLATGILTVRPTLPESFHKTIYDAFDRIVPSDHVEVPGKAKPHNPGNNIVPMLPQLAELWEDPIVKGALTSILGPDHALDPHRALHNNMPHDGEQPMHKDSFFAFKRHVRTHRPWTLLMFYYPQDTPPERGPTGVVPGSHYALRNPGILPNDSHALGGPAGSCAIAMFDVWHARMRNFTNSKRFMLKFLFNRMSLPDGPSWDCADDRWTDPQNAPRMFPLSPVWQANWNWMAGRTGPAAASGAETVADLTARMRGADETAALAAAYTLAGQGEEGLSVLSRALLDGKGESLPEDKSTTGDLGDRHAEDPVARAAAFGLASTGAAAASTFAAATHSPSGFVRKLGAFGLGEIGVDAATDAALTAAAGDADDQVRINALYSIGRRGELNGFAPALAAGLSDPEEEVRVHAALALARTTPADDTVTDLALGGLKDQNRYVVGYGVETLDRIGTPKALRGLIPFLKTARWCHFTRTGESIY